MVLGGTRQVRDDVSLAGIPPQDEDAADRGVYQGDLLQISSLGLPESNRTSSFEKSGIRGRRHSLGVDLSKEIVRSKASGFAIPLPAMSIALPWPTLDSTTFPPTLSALAALGASSLIGM